MECRPVQPAGSARRILYRPESEATGRLAVDQYGTSYVTEAYVAAQIAVTIESDRYGRVERGFWDYQDRYLVAGAEQRDPAEFSYVRLADLRRRRLPPWWRRVRARSKR